MSTTNWARNISFAAARCSAPTSVAQLRELVAGSRRVRALGTGHSFNDIADTPGDLVSVAGLPPVVEVDATAGTVTVSAGLRFGEVAAHLHEAGFALHNLGSLPHISIAGACATGTHGSGRGNGSLATAVRSFEMVAGDGELVTVGRADADFAGSVVALGMLGIVTKMTLDTVPAFDVQQWVYEGLPEVVLREQFDEVMSAAYSVSLFTDWRTDRIGQVWLKHHVGPEGPKSVAQEWLGATLSDGPRHPLPGISPEPCTQQLGVPGPWHTRLPHFRLDFTPSNGDELQSEYFVAREDAAAAFDALGKIRALITPVLQVGEIRAVAGDGLWLSTVYRRDSVAFHFTWIADTGAVTPVLRVIEEALKPFAARPHWGKLFTVGPEVLRPLYPRFDDFQRLAAKSDPAGKFRNVFIERVFGAADWAVG